MSLLFIINPTAGKNKARKSIPIIKKIMNKTGKKYKIMITDKPKHATSIAYEALSDGYYNTVIAVGGDGTVNEVARGVLRAGCGTLGVIPAGTGNDLARTLNIPEQLENSIELIIENRTKKVDVGQVNKNLLFTNVASIGFDSEVLKSTEIIKRKFKGEITYTLGLLKTLFTYKSKQMEIKLDDIVIKDKILLAAVGNGKYYGGGMKICPHADIEDGVFDICIVKDISKLKLLFIFPAVFKGIHGKYKKYVSFYKSSSVNINTTDKALLNVDGDLFNVDNNTTFILNKKQLNIIA